MTSKEQAEELAETAVTALNGAPVKILEKTLLDVIPLTELLEVAKAANAYWANSRPAQDCYHTSASLDNALSALLATGKVKL